LIATIIDRSESGDQLGRRRVTRLALALVAKFKSALFGGR
jgi:hypothetical protein